MAGDLDSALRARIRQVLRGRDVTEGELRELTDEAGGRARELEAEVAAGERRLAELTGEPDSSIAEIADALRRVEALRPALEETRGLLEALDGRAHELRAAWLRAARNS